VRLVGYLKEIFYNKLKASILNLPATEIMEGELILVFVADDALKLH